MEKKMPPPAKNPGKLVPHTSINVGDAVVGGATGYWVCIAMHTSGSSNSPEGLRPGQSNDKWHWVSTS